MIGSYHYMYAKHNCSGHITHIKQTHIDDGTSISHASPLFHQSLLNGSIFPPFSFCRLRSLKNVLWFFFLFLIWNMHWNSEFNKFEVSAWAQYITSITVWALSWLLLTRVLCYVPLSPQMMALCFVLVLGSFSPCISPLSLVSHTSSLPSSPASSQSSPSSHSSPSADLYTTSQGRSRNMFGI